MFGVPRARRRAGLTLVEVMLAVTIMGVGIAALAAAASSCIGVARKARHYENARRLLTQIELEDPLIAREEIEEGDEEGQFDAPYNAYRWTRAIALEGKEEDGLFKITMAVSWTERRKGISEQVVTYLHAPQEKRGGTVESK